VASTAARKSVLPGKPSSPIALAATSEYTQRR
jgi:hypothetical protein